MAHIFPDAQPVASVSRLSREEWLNLRREGIGGSDASSIVGLNPWRSALSCFADKLGQLSEEEESLAMRLGTELEDFVARLWSEQTGRAVKRCGYMYRNRKRPWQIANIDRCVVGESAGLECKTTSSFETMRKCKNGDIPDTYYCQCMHYMAVTGAKRWYLAVLSLQDKVLHTFVIERDDEEIEALNKAEEDFWLGNVCKEIPPLPDGSDSAKAALGALYPQSEEGMSEDLGDIALEIADYVTLKAEYERLKKQLELFRQRICARMGKAEQGECASYRISYKSYVTSGKVNAKQLAIEFPEAYARCRTPDTISRRLLIKEIS